jgi:ATP-dependent Lon protease
MAFLSALLGLSVPDDVAFTGAVVCDAHDVIALGRIGDVDAKIEGAYECRLRQIVVPAANREDVAHAERVPRRIAERMVVFARTLEEALAAVFPDLG